MTLVRPLARPAFSSRGDRPSGCGQRRRQGSSQVALPVPRWWPPPTPGPRVSARTAVLAAGLRAPGGAAAASAVLETSPGDDESRKKFQAGEETSLQGRQPRGSAGGSADTGPQKGSPSRKCPLLASQYVLPRAQVACCKQPPTSCGFAQDMSRHARRLPRGPRMATPHACGTESI